MQYAPEDKLDIYSDAQIGLATLESNPEKQLKYVEFIDYYADLTEQETQNYRERYTSRGHVCGFYGNAILFGSKARKQAHS